MSSSSRGELAALALALAVSGCGGWEQRQYCWTAAVTYSEPWPTGHVWAILTCDSTGYWKMRVLETKVVELGAMVACSLDDGPEVIEDCVLTAWLDLGQDDGETCFVGTPPRLDCGPDPGDPAQVQAVVLRAGGRGANPYHVDLEAP